MENLTISRRKLHLWNFPLVGCYTSENEYGSLKNGGLKDDFLFQMGHFQVPFAPLSHQELPKVRPKTVVRFSRERQSYSVHYSDYVPRC